MCHCFSPVLQELGRSVKGTADTPSLTIRHDFENRTADAITQFLDDPASRHGGLKDPSLAQRANVFLTQVRRSVYRSQYQAEGTASGSMPSHHLSRRIVRLARDAVAGRAGYPRSIDYYRGRGPAGYRCRGRRPGRLSCSSAAGGDR